MVVAARIAWLRGKLAVGHAARVNVSTAGHGIRLRVCLSPLIDPNLDNSPIIALIDGVSNILQLFIAVDHGHKSSDGRSFSSLSLKRAHPRVPPGLHQAIPRGANGGMPPDDGNNSQGPDPWANGPSPGNGNKRVRFHAAGLDGDAAAGGFSDDDDADVNDIADHSGLARGTSVQLAPVNDMTERPLLPEESPAVKSNGKLDSHPNPVDMDIVPQGLYGFWRPLGAQDEYLCMGISKAEKHGQVYAEFLVCGTPRTYGPLRLWYDGPHARLAFPDEDWEFTGARST